MLHDHPWFVSLLTLWALAGIVASLALWRIPAPYGRHVRPGWGPVLPPGWAWFCMESPGAWILAGMMLAGRPCQLLPALFGLLWIGHYFYRGFLYPALLRSTKGVPLFIVLSAIGFHCANASLQGWELYQIRPDRPLAWLYDPRFLVGLGLFVCGFAIAVSADMHLRRLRSTPGQQYQIPRGGVFEYVSCPNYLGEVVEWTGWAIMTWTWSGLVFAGWVVANLLPRAAAHHRWYRQQFADYPAQRKALFPGLW